MKGIDRVVQVLSKDPYIRMMDVRMPTSNPNIIHIYIITSKGENLVVDTGTDWSKGREDLKNGLDELSLDYEHTSLFLTHAHPDHTGLAKIFTDQGCKVYMGELENQFYHWFASTAAFQDMTKLVLEAGAPIDKMLQEMNDPQNRKNKTRKNEKEMSSLSPDKPHTFDEKYIDQNKEFIGQEKFKISSNNRDSVMKMMQKLGPAMKQAQLSSNGLSMEYPIIKLNDGDQFLIGDMTFQAILSPGHTPGHMMLYMPAQQILFTGDHVLAGIVPIIDNPLYDSQPLTHYFKSLKNLKQLAVKRVFPGHGELNWDFQKRVDELMNIHREELDYIIHALDKQPGMTAWQIVQIVREMRGKYPWKKMPIVQQVMATEEIIPHLKYLQDEGKLRVEKEENTLRYSSI